ncbi:MAG: copper homeostasis protein CutC [Geminicoccaceae bacterium]
MPGRPVVEVCCDSQLGVLAAALAGAERVELCRELAVDGLTPPEPAIAAARAVPGLRLHVLVRPRAGDFVHDAGEVATMLADIRRCRELGADGVAIGCLGADGRVDRGAMRQLIAAARPMAVTFHRAFDQATDLPEALETLVDLGVDRVLTAGAPGPADAASLARLVRQAAGRIAVIACGGLRAHNVGAVLAACEAPEIHFSQHLVPGGAVDPATLSGAIRAVMAAAFSRSAGPSARP